ncbi:MAG: 30S ribosomal protein S2 [Phycisphaerae bacterium]|nr:30S ribosomal protein S2 [Phycisphaerae bacterium]
MAENVIRNLIDAGIHFGHRVSRWNPKMKPYILAKRNSIHIIDPKETLRGLLAAKKFFTRLAGEGKEVLLVGTKRQARKSVESGATRVGMHYVNERWLGGTLTNLQTIRSRLTRLEKLEQLDAEGLMAQHSKKEDARLRREMRKIKRNLEGVRNMSRLPGAMFVVDASREVIALREARKLGIPTIALIDTDSNPDTVDIPIPGNDDAMRAIMLITKEICDAIEIGKAGRTDKAEVQPAASEPAVSEPAALEPVAPAEIVEPEVQEPPATPVTEDNESASA